jgi:hypothetical protein
MEEFTDWEQLVLDLKYEYEVTRFESTLKFTKSNANIEAQFSDRDINTVKETFTDDMTGEISMQFKVIARAAGSETHGVDASESDLVTGTFKVKIITPE